MLLLLWISQIMQKETKLKNWVPHLQLFTDELSRELTARGHLDDYMNQIFIYLSLIRVNSHYRFMYDLGKNRGICLKVKLYDIEKLWVNLQLFT